MMSADEACAEYERRAVGVARLTHAIRTETCPKESPDDFTEEEGSCFMKAKNETTDADNFLPGHGVGR